MPVITVAAGGLPTSLFQELMREKPAAKRPKQLTLADAYHYGHEIDSTGRQPFCNECGVYV